MTTLLVKNGTLVTMGPGGIIKGDILVLGDLISRVDASIEEKADTTIDATDMVVMPGMIQTHVHLCQTLFRGSADDMELLDWLRERTFPLEAAHDNETAYYSAFLGCMELIRSGTTCIACMGSTRNADSDAQAMYDIGIRGMFGKAMMDRPRLTPELGELPPAMRETTEESIDRSLALLRQWNGKGNGRIHYLFAPRGALVTTSELLRETKRLADEYGTGVHTHACENRTETELVREQQGVTDIRYLHMLGLTGPNLMLAHCIWIDSEDIEILAKTRSKVLHCPSCNLKVASGIAPIPEILASGVCTSIGADSPPANNNLDAFIEMRTAALIQKGRLLRPTVMPAATVVEMITTQGARALGLEHTIGSIEPGKKADLVVLDLEKPHTVPHRDIVSTLVYAAGRDNVVSVLIDGKLVYDKGHFTGFDETKMLSQIKASSDKLHVRAGIGPM